MDEMATQFWNGETRIVISDINTKPMETKRIKTSKRKSHPKHSFEFMMRRNTHPRMLKIDIFVGIRRKHRLKLLKCIELG